MNEIRVQVGRSGRIIIPAPHRRALGIKEGDVVYVGLEGTEATIRTQGASRGRAREIVGRYGKGGGKGGAARGPEPEGEAGADDGRR